jgi:phage gp36-like protein
MESNAEVADKRAERTRLQRVLDDAVKQQDFELAARVKKQLTEVDEVVIHCQIIAILLRFILEVLHGDCDCVWMCDAEGIYENDCKDMGV